MTMNEHFRVEIGKASAVPSTEYIYIMPSNDFLKQLNYALAFPIQTRQFDSSYEGRPTGLSLLLARIIASIKQKEKHIKTMHECK